MDRIAESTLTPFVLLSYSQCSETPMHTPTICINTTHVHKCIHMHTCHTYTNIYTTHIYTNLYTYHMHKYFTHTKIHAHSHACMPQHICKCTYHMHKYYTNKNAYIWTYIHAIYKCTYICIHKCTRLHACMPHTYTIAHVDMHTCHTHIQIHSYRQMLIHTQTLSHTQVHCLR